jgi:hypothetical protein
MFPKVTFKDTINLIVSLELYSNIIIIIWC